MKLKEIYDSTANGPDLVDLIELLREIEKDNKELRVLPLKEVRDDLIFNRLLLEYQIIKDKYAEAQSKNPNSFTREDLKKHVTRLVTSQPNFREALEYMTQEEDEEQENKEEEEDLVQ